MISKCSIFVSAISVSIFGSSDWTLAESTLSLFSCVSVCRCGGGGGGDGGGSGDGGGGVLLMVVRMVVVVRLVVVMILVVVILVVVIFVGRNVSTVYLWGSHLRWEAFRISR